MSLNDNPISIRRFRPVDTPFLFNAVRESFNELCAFTTWCHPNYSLEDSRAFIARCDSNWEKGDQYNFAIFDVNDESLLGSIGLNRIDRTHNFANIGYWVRRSHARRGVATVATRLIAGFGLKELGFYRLEILVPDHNLASQRVAQKAGAKFEGVLRKKLVLADGSHDAFVYSFVAADLTHR
jgi:ribosomal-protein-serine acetyltransferase